MDEEKEMERIKNINCGEMDSEGLITLSQNPEWQPTKNPIKIEVGKTATEVLFEMRAEERY